MPYIIRSYEGQDDWGNRKWLAHLDMGDGDFVGFFGSTKAEAENEARAWYEQFTNAKPKANEALKNLINSTAEAGWGSVGWGKPSESEWGKNSNIEWRNPEATEHGMTGKVWMINKDNHRVRIAADQVDEYTAKGYVQGGPRSVWKE
jgi:hypothetical protein